MPSPRMSPMVSGRRCAAACDRLRVGDTSRDRCEKIERAKAADGPMPKPQPPLANERHRLPPERRTEMMRLRHERADRAAGLRSTQGHGSPVVTRFDPVHPHERARGV
eukprot:3402879-Prymnesium_polylepis.2